MEALSLLNLQPQLLHFGRRSFHHQKSFHSDNRISFSYVISPSFLSSSSSFRTQSSIQNDRKSPQTLKLSELSVALKLPLTVLVSAALFLSRFTLRSQPAFAKPLPLPATSTTLTETLSGDLNLTKEDAIPKDGTGLNNNDINDNDVFTLPKDEKALEEYLNSHPEDAEALQSLLDLKINSQLHRGAIDIISRLIKLQPAEEELELRNLRGQMYISTGDFKSAKAELISVLEEDPTQVEALHGLLMILPRSPESGDIRKELRQLKLRVEGAMGICEIVGKIGLQLRELKLLSAQIKVMEGEYADAMKVYRELNKEDPDDFRPYLCQGVIYSMLLRKNDAERQFEECRKRIPENHPYMGYFEEDVMEFAHQFTGGRGGRRRKSELNTFESRRRRR